MAFFSSQSTQSLSPLCFPHSLPSCCISLGSAEQGYFPSHLETTSTCEWIIWCAGHQLSTCAQVVWRLHQTVLSIGPFDTARKSGAIKSRQLSSLASSQSWSYLQWPCSVHGRWGLTFQIWLTRSELLLYQYALFYCGCSLHRYGAVVHHTESCSQFLTGPCEKFRSPKLSSYHDAVQF